MSTVTNDTDLNPTAASLLGYLDVGPMTGWDINEFVRASIGNFWNVTRSQIYRELRTLTERGYVKAGSSGPRDRVPYAITNKGRAAFKKWIAEAPTPDTIRSRLLLTIFFGHHLPPDRLREIAESERQRHQATLEGYLALEPQLAVDPDQLPAGDAALRHPLRAGHDRLARRATRPPRSNVAPPLA